MPDQQSIEDQVREVLRSLDSNTPSDQPITIDSQTGAPIPAEQEATQTFHIYPMGEGFYVTTKELDEDAIGQGIVTSADDQAHLKDAGAAQTATVQPPVAAKSRQSRIWIIATVLLAGLLVVENISPLFHLVSQAIAPPPAQVVLMVKATPYTQRYTFSTAPDRSRNTSTIASRLLRTITAPTTKTVPTTGIAYTPATSATGTLTFYNSAPFSQTITQGTVLSSAGSIQVITDATITIGPGNPPYSYGISPPVPAHTRQTGEQSNISALAINGLTQIAGISAKNTSAFSGGADPKPYHIVSQTDVQNVLHQVNPLLLSEATHALTQAVLPNERQLTPPACTPQTQSQPPIGGKAESTTVSVTAACQLVVFNYQELTQQASSMFLRDAATQLGKNFSPTAAPHLTLGTIQETSMATYTLHTMLSAQFLPLFTHTRQAALARQIAGKTPLQAQRILEQAGAAQVTINLPDTTDTTLPTDIQRITFVLIET